MTFKTYDIKVDLVTDASTPCAIRFSQNDRNSAKLLLTITNKGAEVDLSQAKSVRMSFKKSDGTRVFQNDCQPINALKGKYQILLKTQTLTSVGNVIAQIHIEEEDRTIDTQKFFFVVNESLASDDSIESTNEFSVIQKSLEVGERFKGVDFGPIIAAGELAKGAVPKTGGTMTGDLTIERNDTGKYARWTNKNAQEYSLGTAVNGFFELYDAKGKLSPFTYNPTTKEFNINTATNVVKKSGDTMSGNLKLPRLETIDQTPVIFNGNTSNRSWKWDLSGDNLSVTPTNATAPGWDAPKTVVLQNLAKKTGDTFTGNIHLDQGTATDRRIAWTKDDNLLWGLTSSQTGVSLYNWKNNKRAFDYNGDTDTFNVTATNTNLLKKTGDTYTGQLEFHSDAPSMKIQQPATAPSARGMWFSEGGVDKGGIGRYRSNVDTDEAYFMGWGPSPWVKSNSFSVTKNGLFYKTYKVMVADNDGRATLTLTAEAESTGGGYTPQATRRGNTVTLRAKLKRKPGSTSPTVITLPATMRPIDHIEENLIADDGTLVKINIGVNGKVDVYSIDKPIVIFCTYVVD